MTSGRGHGKGPVSRVRWWTMTNFVANWFRSNPEILRTNKTLIFQLPRAPHTFLLHTRYIYRRKKEHEKKMFQTSGRGESEKKNDNDDEEKDKNTPMAQHKGPTNSLKSLLLVCKRLSNCLPYSSCGFRVNSQTVRNWPILSRKPTGYSVLSSAAPTQLPSSLTSMALHYSTCFWTWRIWVSAGNRSKLPEMPPTCLNGFITAYGIVPVDFGWICKCPELSDWSIKTG